MMREEVCGNCWGTGEIRGEELRMVDDVAVDRNPGIVYLDCEVCDGLGSVLTNIHEDDG